MRSKAAPTTSVDVYIAGPFFKPAEQEFCTQVENALDALGLTYFSPRRGTHSQQMNVVLANRREWLRNRGFGPGVPRPAQVDRDLDRTFPLDQLTQLVFADNVAYIETCRLMTAYIDDFDPGTLWEMGAAYMADVPVISVTNRGFGTNLMLVHSVVAHCKGLPDLHEALQICRGLFRDPGDAAVAADAYARLQARFLQRGQSIEDEGSLRP